MRPLSSHRHVHRRYKQSPVRPLIYRCCAYSAHRVCRCKPSLPCEYSAVRVFLLAACCFHFLRRERGFPCLIKVFKKGTTRSDLIPTSKTCGPDAAKSSAKNLRLESAVLVLLACPSTPHVVPFSYLTGCPVKSCLRKNLIAYLKR